MNNLTLTSITWTLLGCLLIPSLSSCARDTKETSRDAEIYLIPEGYVGSFYILFNIPQGEPQEYEADARVYEIPEDGMLMMQSDPNEGWIQSNKIDFFFVAPDGTRTRITERWTTSLKDTPENRMDEHVTVFGGGIGVFEPIRHCQITETNFYVGTKAQALDGQGFFDLFSERGVEQIPDEIFLEACTK
ncbi:DUF6843 domain-containing protein [Marinobacter sp. CA1]|uniref:DUF6843 domain-containing protein n=1 Tax=Marinobacter sp. CA1 TaxID=2817656 RepID=UPI001D070CD7|nr:hypothetical protein [Marinobacter sp. CA1]UDL04695.1 hypothetical protein J2887_18805 [Marinobacter sp. CA1]